MRAIKASPIVLAILLSIGLAIPMAAGNEADRILQAMRFEETCNENSRLALLNSIEDVRSSAIESVTNSLLGRILEKQKWISISDSARAASRNTALARYYTKRENLELNISSHLELANYCLRLKLYNQARGHLEAILLEQPNNANIRAILGHSKLGERWVTPEFLMEINCRLETQAASIQFYSPIFEKINSDLQSPSPKKREAARAQFKSIEGIGAVPAMEQAAFTSLPLAPFAIQWLIEDNTVASSRSLMRAALTHDDASVRQLATQELCKRPLNDFVPEALAMLSSGYAGSFMPLFDRMGRPIGVRQVCSSEQFDMNQIQIADKVGTTNRPTPGFATNRIPRSRALRTIENTERFLTEQALENMQREATLTLMRQELISTHRQLAERNIQIREINQKISSLLSAVSSVDFQGDEKRMWEWWDEYNDNEYQQGKPTYSEYYSGTSFDVGYSQDEATYECFVAGTRVTTKRGLVAIEKIKVGDEVLTRNVKTASLEWKPVIQPTQRPARPIITVQLDKDTFECTEGHLFWVSGAGWMPAKHLKEGQVLHGAESPATVRAVSSGKTEPTFNLLVAGNSNYFVGQSMILSHDVTMRGPERQPTPGYALVTALQSQKGASE